jgi:hypothetical protein
MANPATTADTAAIGIRVFDGSRQPFPQGTQILYRIIDGRNTPQREQFVNAPAVRFTDLPVFDNLFDNYRVIVSTHRYLDAGLSPVHVEAGQEIVIELLLVPQNGAYNFAQAQFGNLGGIDPKVPDILSSDLGDAAAAATRWSDKFEQAAPTAACLLNILTVMANSTIAGGQQLLGFLKQAIFDDQMKQDRFFGWADRTLIQALQQAPQASDDVLFVPADFSLHPGATSSVKSKQYPEANLQLTFHEDDAPPPGHPDWVKVEPDIDYFDDPLAHFFLEVIPNKFSGGLTDPAQVLALRWMAERRAGKDFNPRYTIRPA